MTTPVTTVPRLDDESTRAHAAKIVYVTMGPQRSLEAVGQKLGKSKALMERWSVAHDWAATARAWDDQQAAAALAQAAEQYARDLEAHRARAKRSADELYAVAAGLLQQCARAVRGQTIEGKDGKLYTIPAMELTPATFGTAMRGLLAALDLEAHALGVDKLLPTLGGNDE